MGDPTLQTAFSRWFASHGVSGFAGVVLGEEELRHISADTGQLWDRVALFDVLRSLPPIAVFLRIDPHLAEACEIVIAAPAVRESPAVPNEWKRATLDAAQRFGFGETGGSMPAPPEIECLHLRRVNFPALRLGMITGANAAEMRTLFGNIFGHTMSEAFWRWKYREGKSHGMGLWQGKELVAHYGGLAEDVVLDGEHVNAMQMVDVMVDPKVRHAPRRQSPFFLLTSAFVECFIGWRQPYLLAFGFPSNRHLRLAEHLKLYAPVGRMSEIIFAPRKLSLWSTLPLQVLQVSKNNLQTVQGALDQLWRTMQAALPTTTLVKKNAARIEQRYLRHPELSYRVLLIRKRWSGQPLALVVLKEEAEKTLLMDIVGDPDSFAMAIDVVQTSAHKKKVKELTAWISSNCVSALATPGDQINELPISVPTITWTAGPSPELLKDRWWLTAGDTDFL